MKTSPYLPRSTQVRQSLQIVTQSIGLDSKAATRFWRYLRLPFLLLLLWLSPQLAMGQPVYTGDVAFTSQAEVDAWSPAYTSITGSMTISGADITDLTPLQNITSVGIVLLIQNNPALTSLSGLDALTYIWILNIVDNAALTSLTGLDAITYFGGLYIENNDALTSLAGLDAVTYIGEFFIQNNAVLTSLTGLDAVTVIGNVLISDNASLTSLTGLDAVTSTLGLYIVQNAALTSLTGLNAITSIGGNLVVSSNNALTSLTGLNAVTSIGGDLGFDSNASLTSLTGLNALTSIGASLLLISNNALTSLTGLEALTSIGGYIYCSSNNALTSLTGLNALASIGGDLNIWYNDALTSLSGLSAVTSVGGSLGFFGNTALTSLTGLDALTSIGGGIYIQGTALTSLIALNAITSIGGRLYLTQNAALTSLTGLDALTSVGEELTIYDNGALTSLVGLDAVTSVGGLFVSYNATLTNLTGLDALTTIEGDIRINYTALTSLTGLEALASVGGNLDIQDNSPLSDCCPISDLLNTPGAIAGSITIQNNQTGCDSEAEINASCTCPDADNDSVCDNIDNCPNTANPDQEDDDCDGVGNDCDVCPGGDDSVDNNNDGLPDCKYPPTFAQIIAAWKCGNNFQKVSVCHNGTNTMCLSYNALAAHIAHGDYLGPCDNASCTPFLLQLDDGFNLQAHVERRSALQDRNLDVDGLSVYPNPARDELLITANNLSVNEPVLLVILDMTGRECFSQTLPNGMSAAPLPLHLNDLKNGFYMLMLKPASGQILAQRFAVMRE